MSLNKGCLCLHLKIFNRLQGNSDTQILEDTHVEATEIP